MIKKRSRGSPLYLMMYNKNDRGKNGGKKVKDPKDVTEILGKKKKNSRKVIKKHRKMGRR